MGYRRRPHFAVTITLGDYGASLLTQQVENNRATNIDYPITDITEF